MTITPNHAYQTRFGKDVPCSITSDVINQQLTRATIRKFSGKSIEPGLLELLVASAQCTPTSGNGQNYSVVALTRDEAIDILDYENNKDILGLASDSQNLSALHTCDTLLVWLADLNRTNVLINQVPDIDPNVANQPNTAEYHLKAIVDASIAAQSFTISAESVGLGVMYWGALRQLPIELLEEKLNLPKLTFPLFGMLIGYPDTSVEINIRPRIDTNLILHRRTYKQITNFNDLSEYKKRFELRAIRDKRHKTLIGQLVDRLHVADCKAWIANSLKHMGFTFK